MRIHRNIMDDEGISSYESNTMKSLFDLEWVYVPVAGAAMTLIDEDQQDAVKGFFD